MWKGEEKCMNFLSGDCFFIYIYILYWTGDCFFIYIYILYWTGDCFFLNQINRLEKIQINKTKIKNKIKYLLQV